MSASPSLPSADTVIVGVGARSGSGLTALQVTMSARAKKRSIRASHMIDKAGEKMGTVRLASIADNVFGIDRFVALGGAALTQAAFPWLAHQRQRGVASPSVAVYVALPSQSRPGVDPRLKQHLLTAMEARSRVAIDHAKSKLVFGCRGGGVAAFEQAAAAIASGSCEAVAVGGIDSYFDPDVLEWLDRELRLHAMDTENGFIPGEGAAFVLLAHRRLGQGLYRYAKLLAAAAVDEPRPYGSEEPTLGLGITLAVKRATAPARGASTRIPWALTDVANERHRVDEWGYATARNHEALAQELVHDQPLLETGDLGAASAAMLAVMASVRWQTGCGGGPLALIATHSDGPERGAMLLGAEGTS